MEYIIIILYSWILLGVGYHIGRWVRNYELMNKRLASDEKFRGMITREEIERMRERVKQYKFGD